MTLAEEIISVLRGVTFSQIPSLTVERAKLFIIDTIGVALAGKGAEGVEAAVDTIMAIGGAKDATILCYGKRAPAPHAAMANAMMIHCRDYDDLYEPGGVHVNVSVVPAALAVAQKKGGVSGKEFITAVILAVDLVCRLAVSVPVFRGWHVTSTFGIFGAALAAGLILKLPQDSLADALGIAYSQAAGTRQGRLEGSLTKRLQPALACQAGVLAALLAQRGITGPREWIEGSWGLARVYGDSHESIKQQSIEKLHAALGKTFLGDELSFKCYPCCKVAHTAIEATLDLARENNIEAVEVKKVLVEVSSGAYNTVGRPFEIRKNPQVDAQFSIPYTVALALIKKEVRLSGFEEKTIRNPAIFELSKRVHVMVNPEMIDSSTHMVNLAAKVAIHTDRGIFSRHLATCRGNPLRPLDKEEVFRKFQDCATYGKALSEKEIEKILDSLTRLEDIEDIDEIFSTIKWL
ncbi:MAG: MmgE/PrpD family protein [Deltaproteobacteria bacterium]|nr:MmgE/PrpD family protein [Deltaproteobacteria bacterium]MBW2152969.1 MmgE/PrpD family protein [Deltaproteobacteria bacterium]